MLRPCWNLAAQSRLLRTAWRTNTQTLRPKSKSKSKSISISISSPARAFRSSAWRRASDPGSKTAETLSLSARLKKLSREYGWAAVGVYLGLSVLDFPFCFLLVRTVGTERIGQVEHYVVSGMSSVVPESVRLAARGYWQRLGGEREQREPVDGPGWGVEQARERNQEEASLATQLALAYAIHKSFIFLRVPLTAAVTPKVVRVLRSWGWNIGRKTR